MRDPHPSAGCHKIDVAGRAGRSTISTQHPTIAAARAPSFAIEERKKRWKNGARALQHPASYAGVPAQPPKGAVNWYWYSPSASLRPDRVGVAGAQKNQRSYKCLDFISKARRAKPGANQID